MRRWGEQEPYTGGWCRPQTDGPALRAMSMAKWGNILIDAGKEDEAKSVIWPLIEYDLGKSFIQQMSNFMNN